ncbi:hypothetical protein Neosp_002503 [[Neocosmospora] mangrovei]
MSALEPVEDTPAPVLFCLKHIFADPNTTEKRAPGALISKPSDLSAAEKGMAINLLDAWCRNHRGGSEPLLVTDSGKIIGRDPQLLEQTDDDIFIEVGTVDTGLSGTRKRKRGQDDVSQTSLSGLQGATAYLGLELGYRPLTWIGKYKSKEAGQEEGPIDPSLINYSLYEDEASAFRACIANYDNSEIRRVEAYNREYLLTLARRRAAHFSETGPQCVPIIRSKDFATKVEPLVLASVALNELNTFTASLAVGGLPIGRIEDDF